MRATIIVAISLLLCALLYVVTMANQAQPHGPHEVKFDPKFLGFWICGCILVMGGASFLIWKKKK
jgi:hypothetical protein